MPKAVMVRMDDGLYARATKKAHELMPQVKSPLPALIRMAVERFLSEQDKTRERSK
jgi:hypothetical protein